MKIPSTTCSYQRIIGKTLTKGILISFFLVCTNMLKNTSFKSPPVVDMKYLFALFMVPLLESGQVAPATGIMLPCATC